MRDGRLEENDVQSRYGRTSVRPIGEGDPSSFNFILAYMRKLVSSDASRIPRSTHQIVDLGSLAPQIDLDMCWKVPLLVWKHSLVHPTVSNGRHSSS